MKTTTTDSAGLSCMGRITVNSTTAASTKDSTTVAKKAAQYGRPAWIRLQAMKVENMAISPWAKLMWCVAW
ncbi:hypothetical protein D3C80_1862500 [compost metagenome]